jgi:hypothetical protein
MLASRGAVYKTAQTAGLAHGTHKYHDHCGCFVVPIYDTHKTWPGIGPQLQDLWGKSTSGKSGQQAINAFRTAYNDKFPPGTNPSQVIADAQTANLKKAEAVAKARFETKAARAAAEAAAEAEAAAQAAADAAAEAERIAAQEAEGMTLPKPKPENLEKVGSAGGTHGATIYRDVSTGEKWIFKGQADLLSDVDVSTAKLAHRVGMPAPDTYYYELKGTEGSLQHMLPGGEAFPHGFDPATLSESDILDLQKSQVVDWLTANHDAHYGNFVRDAEGHLVGIDKGQAFKFLGRDELSPTFHPNTVEKEPVYNTLWRAFEQGKVDLLDPSQGELSIFIKAVQDIPDDDIRAMFRPYAEDATKRGWLGTGKASGKLFPSEFPPNDVEAFLDAIVERKNQLGDNFDFLYKAERVKYDAVKAAEHVKQVEADLAAQKAKDEATKAKKWKGKPAPKPPVEPKPPHVDPSDYFDGWLAKLKARYSDFSGGKSLEASNNWSKVQSALTNYDTPEGKLALKALHDRQYVDDALMAEFDAVTRTIETDKAAALKHPDYLKALRSYKNQSTRYKRYLGEWQEVNGVSASLRGMDAPALKHATHEEGKAWADKAIPKPTGPQATKIKAYSGSDFSPWNGDLRRLKDGNELPEGAFKNDTKTVDASMHPIPDDVLVHRGTTFQEFEFPDGTRTYSVPPPDPSSLKGTVQTQHGYMSTSVGPKSAFYSQPVQLILRVPAGSKAAWVNPVSKYKDIEYELLLARSTKTFVHDVYKRADGKWVVELEVLPADADAAHYEGLGTMPFADRPKGYY